jgi:hypothetical protein
MRPERWQQVEELFNAAMELATAQRDTFLRRTCGGDESLRSAVERLLLRQPEAEGFLESPAITLAADWLANNESPAGGVDLTPNLCTRRGAAAVA